MLAKNEQIVSKKSMMIILNMLLHLIYNRNLFLCWTRISLKLFLEDLVLPIFRYSVKSKNQDATLQFQFFRPVLNLQNSNHFSRILQKVISKLKKLREGGSRYRFSKVHKLTSLKRFNRKKTLVYFTILDRIPTLFWRWEF